jgi:uncharacterized protein YciU (UPF0263 family)
MQPGEHRDVVGGEVAARTFHRDHFLLSVQLDARHGAGLGDHADDVQVEVPVDADRVPEVGDRVALAIDIDDLVRFD